MKKLFILILACTIILTLAACGEKQEATKLSEFVLNDIKIDIDESNRGLMQELGYNIKSNLATWISWGNDSIYAYDAESKNTEVAVDFDENGDMTLFGVASYNKNAKKVKFIHDITIDSDIDDIKSKLSDYQMRTTGDKKYHTYYLFSDEQHTLMVCTTEGDVDYIFLYNNTTYQRKGL